MFIFNFYVNLIYIEFGYYINVMEVLFWFITI